MKLNAKLGGTTSKVADSRPPKPFFTRPTMIIGKYFAIPVHEARLMALKVRMSLILPQEVIKLLWLL